MEKWYVAAKKADFDKWAKEFHISPVTARILRNRDLTEESEIQKFLYGKLEDCYSPWLLKDMDKAVEEILKAVREGLHIRVIGDYDVDGICSSYILTKGFQMLGALSGWRIFSGRICRWALRTSRLRGASWAARWCWNSCCTT